MSLDEHANGIWDIALRLNSLRNELAHSLKTGKRESKTKALIEAYNSNRDLRQGPINQHEEHIIIAFAISFFIGFLGSFHEEVRRFKKLVEALDGTVNPHRYQ